MYAEPWNWSCETNVANVSYSAYHSIYHTSHYIHVYNCIHNLLACLHSFQNLRYSCQYQHSIHQHLIKKSINDEMKKTETCAHQKFTSKIQCNVGSNREGIDRLHRGCWWLHRQTNWQTYHLWEDGRATDEIRQWSKYIGDKLHSYWRKPPKKVRNCKVEMRESIEAWHRLDTTGREMMIKEKDYM